MENVNNETGSLLSDTTFDHVWPKPERLLFAFCLSLFGCLMNAFFFAAFFVDDYLKRIGLLFQACVGLSDMIVSMLVVPISAIVIMSGQGNTTTVCYVLQFMMHVSTYCYSWYIAMTSVETYYRICMTPANYNRLISKRVELVALLIFIMSIILAGIGVYMELDYDCCHRRHSGNFAFRFITSTIFHLLPCVITVFTSVSACLEMKQHADIDIHYRKSRQYKLDRSAHYMNIVAFLLYVSAWGPYIVIINIYPETSNTKLYESVWFGIGRSAITSFLYGLFDSNFRRAFGLLFRYVFCKEAIAQRVVRRNRRACEYRAAASDGRLLMMQQINAYSPRRAVISPRETQA